MNFMGGIFKNPKKATKAFFRNPAKIIVAQLNPTATPAPRVEPKINPPPNVPLAEQKARDAQLGFRNNPDKAIAAGAPPNQYNILPGDSKECQEAKNAYNLYNQRLYESEKTPNLPGASGLNLFQQINNGANFQKASATIPNVCRPPAKL